MKLILSGVCRAPIDGIYSGLFLQAMNKTSSNVARIVDDSRYEINAKLYPDEYAIKLSKNWQCVFLYLTEHIIVL